MGKRHYLRIFANEDYIRSTGSVGRMMAINNFKDDPFKVLPWEFKKVNGVLYKGKKEFDGYIFMLDMQTNNKRDKVKAKGLYLSYYIGGKLVSSNYIHNNSGYANKYNYKFIFKLLQYNFDIFYCVTFTKEYKCRLESLIYERYQS